jgi:hypothetical protein
LRDTVEALISSRLRSLAASRLSCQQRFKKHGGFSTSYSVFYSGGNLNNARNGGPFYVNGNNALTTANWNFGSRNSGFCSHSTNPSVMG